MKDATQLPLPADEASMSAQTRLQVLREMMAEAVLALDAQGNLQGQGSVWGYVEGGMGRISFAIAEAAMEAGAVIAAGAEVAGIEPGEGVRLVSGEFIGAPVVVANADPKRTLAMLDGADLDADYRARLAEWRVASPVVKLNAALSRPPTFTAAPATKLVPVKVMVVPPAVGPLAGLTDVRVGPLGTPGTVVTSSVEYGLVRPLVLYAFTAKYQVAGDRFSMTAVAIPALGMSNVVPRFAEFVP